MTLPNLADPIFIAKIIDFVIFATGLWFLYNTVGKKQLIAAQEAQNKAFDDAVAECEAQGQAVEAAQREVEQAKIDSVRMVEVGKAQAARLVDDERLAAEEHAKRILDHANGELERERYRVRRELLEETVERAHDEAQEMIKRELGPDRQRGLVEKLIAGLERSRA